VKPHLFWNLVPKHVCIVGNQNAPLHSTAPQHDNNLQSSNIHLGSLGLVDMVMLNAIDTQYYRLFLENPCIPRGLRVARRCTRRKFLSRVFVAEQVDATCEDDTGVHIGLESGDEAHLAAESLPPFPFASTMRSAPESSVESEARLSAGARRMGASIGLLRSACGTPENRTGEIERSQFLG
jgi:hypothetical protein